MKNFKCKNSSCGVSFKADKLGPCPVCGSEITKEEKSNRLLIFSFLIIIIGFISILILKPSIFLIENGQDISDESIERANDSTFVNEKCYSDVRLNKPEIRKTLDYHKDYHYKPVWDGTDENLDEIEYFRESMNIPKNKTYIMPAGDTREQLIKMYPLVFDLCAELGYNMTGRDHIIAFDQAREV